MYRCTILLARACTWSVAGTFGHLWFSSQKSFKHLSWPTSVTTTSRGEPFQYFTIDSFFHLPTSIFSVLQLKTLGDLFSVSFSGMQCRERPTSNEPASCLGFQYQTCGCVTMYIWFPNAGFWTRLLWVIKNCLCYFLIRQQAILFSPFMLFGLLACRSHCTKASPRWPTV